jgi:hypothetical protein
MAAQRRSLRLRGSRDLLDYLDAHCRNSPFANGGSRDHTGSYAGGPLLLAGLGFVAMPIVIRFGHDAATEHATAVAAE